MAKSFLSTQAIEEALGLFQPSGMMSSSLSFSQWMEDQLLNKLKGFAEWNDLEVVALGSLARQELCPRSDVDLILIGSDEKVLSFVDHCLHTGVPLRYRVPKDLTDWSVGVEAFDVLALLQAQSLTSGISEDLKKQKNQIRNKGSVFLKTLFRAMIKDRKMRKQRYDSMVNYLEPNIKFGPGGLRDLLQARYVRELYPRVFEDQESHSVLTELYRGQQFFLTIRRRLHLLGRNESISSQDQKELAEWFGSHNQRDFMKTVQNFIKQINFNVDWMIEKVSVSRKQWREIEEIKIEKLKDCFLALESNTSTLMQKKIQSWLFPVSDQNSHSALDRDKNQYPYYGPIPDPVPVLAIDQKKPDHEIGRCLQRHFHLGKSPQYLQALFESGLMNYCLPELQRVSGLVQHDQYHRFTVDAHIKKAVQTVKKIWDNPKRLGRLKLWAEELTDQEGKILLWAAVYHDLAKGLGGDHSQEGAQLIKKDFIQMKWPLRLTVEASWLVERHLDVSRAAFRLNPYAQSTWQLMHEKGIKGDRLRRLSLFTAIDIMATNPEAWTDWKERLLLEFYQAMNSTQAEKFVHLLEKAEAKKLKIDDHFLTCLDPALPEKIPSQFLIADFQRLMNKKDLGTLEPLVIPMGKQGEFWIRFHSQKDRLGLFLEWTKILFASGSQILQAIVQTFDEIGAYDWFQIRSSRSVLQLKKQISHLQMEKVPLPQVFFERVKLVHRDSQEVVLSFRGKDQPGLLLVAAQALADEGCSIRWAKAFTWGRQVDDVFGIQVTSDIETKVERIAQRISMRSVQFQKKL